MGAACLVCTGGAVCGESGRGGTWRGSVQFSQFSSVQFIAVQFSSYCMHTCMHALARDSLHCRMTHGRTPASTARHSRRLLQPLRTCWKPLSPGSLTLSKTRSSACCCSCSIVTQGSRAILLPHSIRKRPRQPESTAANSCSSSIRRGEIRREAAAGDCSSSRHPAA